MTTEELYDLVRELADEVDNAHGELLQLREFEIPLPAKTIEALQEREALSLTLSWVLGRSELSGLREEVEGYYLHMLLKARRVGSRLPGDEPVEGAPVNDDVLRGLAVMAETLRRATIADRILDDRLRGWIFETTIL